ncbi:hypothetical protein BW13_09140 [Bifidobacterium sp. UTCIF-37]|uniref:type I-E CRISPR-associated protein Cas6/Cse3/CasE n=1 Tax=unclassified Bifidobacterium TaxID=2608897 RepID=UPI00215949A5|nr:MULTISPECIES: type I-E CRISPR-associated protein Cas6/Cse3/CasE [unclassified Bifidobacterium]TPF85700.1 hypothetical protein BW13_09140 [Bifidobacterium sp. UTCIF-37]TPF88039.1 hypothetical protein BW11_09175 [Bifidobacterium sp. UTCIF-38]
MTEFSRIIIDARHRRAAYAMASLERLHAIVARSVDPEQAGASRVLWRLDAGRNGSPSRMYIVASVTPDKQVLFEELGVPSSSIATCSYTVQPQGILGDVGVGDV